MWTPKRILIYFASSLGFLAVFAVAYFTLGQWDGLPILPQNYLPTVVVIGPGGEDPPPPPPERELMIVKAFGPECEELKRDSLWLAGRGAIVAFEKFNIEKDGRVRITPFSLGMFSKNKTPDQRFPEINTVQCEYAILTLDQPIQKLSDLGSRKVVAVELGGATGVKIVNNRRSLEKNDDLELYVTEKPLYYEEARNLIWSDGYVKLLDTQSRPQPTQITAVGLMVNLSKDANPNRDKKDKAPAKKDDTVGNVEKITLLTNVDMYLHIDSNSGFLAPNEAEKKPENKTGPAAPAEKARVHIKTNGPFVYDQLKEHARFDAPPNPVLAHDRVTVTRQQNAPAPKAGILTDMLDCDRLDLYFRKKPGTGTDSSEKEIESAIATALPKSLVEMRSEGEELYAIGAEMRYFAAKPGSGPLTIVKGAPMHATRQGNEIHCLELSIRGADAAGLGQELGAKGPGTVDLLDKQTGKLSKHVIFKRSLTYMAKKAKDGDVECDLLAIHGEPSVVDEENKQELHAEKDIIVWLKQPKGDPSTQRVVDPKKKDEPSSRSEPHRLEAHGKVRLRSPELNIDADKVVAIFKDKKLEPKQENILALPAIGPAPQPLVKGDPTGFEKKDATKPPSSPPTNVLGDDKRPGAGPQNAGPPGPDAPPQLGPPAKDQVAKADPVAPKEKEKPKKPVNVSATVVTAYIASVGSVKELIEFVADDKAHVTQDAENPKDKGLDIVGSVLNLVRKPGGDILHVIGDSKKLAQLQLNDTYIFGPVVDIDQVQNIAHVSNGPGAMHMPSNNTLDGKQKEGHITIHWNKEMWFNGRSADFDGGVEAFQDNGKIRCQQMQVTLDRPMVFKETKGQPASKVDKVLCNGKEGQPVFILEEERDPKTNKIILYRRLMLTVVEIDNTEQVINGSGPGVLDMVAEGSANDPIAGGEQKKVVVDEKKKKEDSVLKWTRIRFNGQMISRPLPGGTGRRTTFLSQVRVFHMPGDDPNVRDPGVIGKDGIYLTCEKLTLVQRKMGEKSSQELLADGMMGMVHFQTEEFHGNAKTVNFDDREDRIIFEGNPATLFKKPAIQGAPAQRFQGKKMLYNRKTGELNADGVGVITSWLSPDERGTGFPAGLSADERLAFDRPRDFREWMSVSSASITAAASSERST